MKRAKCRTGRQQTEPQLSALIREALFLEVYQVARRAAQVHASAAASVYPGLDREDLEQDCLLSVFLALARFEPERASIRTYVERIVNTTTASAVRHAKAKKRTVREVAVPESLPFALRIALRVDIERAIRTLSKKDQRIARLLADFNPSEIAQALKISRQSIYRSAEKIQIALRSVGFGEFS